ncbi:DUF1559 domain-containing protein [Blastopirellula marina]|uniref:DUF1559 domain-containing protein n=1 Tax=Blastopirellula marina TaxID=124 RepID=A0A2S8FHX6_9BACT|nr:DUF1559 domain-containing protein [Blastopirellula marina]PQO31757.1 hypothetical protein C5Y98_20305 [Blastopirellula marina]PTL43064.1 DUF1559 domain-containing protein [Blastopirellula marina]
MVRWSIPVLIAIFISVLVFGCRDYSPEPRICCARPVQKNSPENWFRHRMSEILLALRAYHDEFGSLPPASTHDEKGQPLVSWRVLILPQLGYHEIYAQYDQSQPWDSPANLAWAKRTPTPYQDPLQKDFEPGLTTFVGLVGKGTLLSADGGAPRLSLPADDTDNAAFILQDLAQPVIWSQPVDRSPKEILARETLGSEQSPYLNVGLASGRIWQFTHENRHLLEELLAPGEI